jgi:dolichol-phosphate mannosyltransferase
MSKILIILPTYNEAENLKHIISQLRDLNLEIQILVVDDNSPDGTGQIADSLTSQDLFVLHRAKKDGLGPAYLEGFTWALDRGYDFIVEMDADGSHLPAELESLLKAANATDLVIGTRWMPGGKVANWPWYRRAISRFGTSYAAMVLRLPYKDLTSGYRVLSKQLVRKVLEANIQTHGYGFQVELVLLAHESQMVIAQVPITFLERSKGKSKMTGRIVVEAWLKTTILGVSRLLNRR